MSANPKKNDIGTVFQILIYKNGAARPIDAGTGLTIYFRKPDASILEKTATFTTDGTDGKMQYTTVAGDLDQSGLWGIQGKYTIGGSTWRTDWGDFPVDEIIE